jgi:hypothetical protein
MDITASDRFHKAKVVSQDYLNAEIDLIGWYSQRSPDVERAKRDSQAPLLPFEPFFKPLRLEEELLPFRGAEIFPAFLR